MYGCIGRIVVVIALVVLGAVAYATRDRWEPALAARIGMHPARVATFGWQPITPEGAERARAAIDSLRRPTGPVFVNVRAADLVAYAVEPVVRRLASDTGKGAMPPSANVAENILMIRGTVRMSELGGAAALGPLAGVLEGSQAVELRGHVEVTSPGHATFQVTRISVGSLVLPSAAIGRVVQQIVPRHDAKQPDDVIPFTITPEIADVRITRGRVTLYKAAK